MEMAFLVHSDVDHVGVATMDIPAGQLVTGLVMKGGRTISLATKDAVSFGHKLALVELRAGEEVLEYGFSIGITTKPIGVGEHVHVHNIRSARW